MDCGNLLLSSLETPSCELSCTFLIKKKSHLEANLWGKTCLLQSHCHECKQWNIACRQGYFPLCKVTSQSAYMCPHHVNSPEYCSMGVTMDGNSFAFIYCQWECTFDPFLIDHMALGQFCTCIFNIFPFHSNACVEYASLDIFRHFGFTL